MKYFSPEKYSIERTKRHPYNYLCFMPRAAKYFLCSGLRTRNTQLNFLRAKNFLIFLAYIYTITHKLAIRDRLAVNSQWDTEFHATYAVLAIASPLQQKLISFCKLSLLLQVELYYR